MPNKFGFPVGGSKNRDGFLSPGLPLSKAGRLLAGQPSDPAISVVLKDDPIKDEGHYLPAFLWGQVFSGFSRLAGVFKG